MYICNIYRIFFLFSKGSAQFHYQTNQFITKITQMPLKRIFADMEHLETYEKPQHLPF